MGSILVGFYIFYTIAVLEFRIEGAILGILPGVSGKHSTIGYSWFLHEELQLVVVCVGGQLQVGDFPTPPNPNPVSPLKGRGTE